MLAKLFYFEILTLFDIHILHASTDFLKVKTFIYCFSGQSVVQKLARTGEITLYRMINVQGRKIE